MIFRLLSAQAGLIVITSLVMFMLWGNNSAYSALLGGGVSLLPNICFAAIAFRYRGACAARQIARSFYYGEAAKWLLSIALFVLVFVSVDVAGISFFVAYIVSQSVFWLAPLLQPQVIAKK